MNKNHINTLRTLTSAQSIPALMAAILFILRRDRDEHPCGQFDNAGRWYAKGRDYEVLARCRAPSRAFPWSQMSSCRTLRHCCRYYDIHADKDYLAAMRFTAALDHLLNDRRLPKTAVEHLKSVKELCTLSDF